MTSRTLPRFVSATSGNPPLLVAERVLATCEEQSANARTPFAVMIDFKGRVWIDRPDGAIPEELVCTVTCKSDLLWLAEELASEILERGESGENKC